MNAAGARMIEVLRENTDTFPIAHPSNLATEDAQDVSFEVLVNECVSRDYFKSIFSHLYSRLNI